MKVMMIMHIVMPMTIMEHDESDDDYAHCNADDTIMEQWRLFLSDGFGFHGKPTTEFMGWRRLTPAELLHLDVGSFFLLSIPPNLRHEDMLFGPSKMKFLKTANQLDGVLFITYINTIIIISPPTTINQQNRQQHN
jgi:hypothetical protein